MFISSGKAAATAEAKYNCDLTSDVSVRRGCAGDVHLASHRGLASAHQMFLVFTAETTNVKR